MRQILFIMAFLSLMMLPVSSFAQDVESGDVTHVVQYGENLYRISQRYGVSMQDIMTANEMANPNIVYVGQSLRIPGLSAPTTEEAVNPLVAGTPITHKVGYGENLTAIAQKYGTSVELLLKANNIANMNVIYPNMELQIWTQDNAASETEMIDNAEEQAIAEIASEPPAPEIATSDNPYVHVVQRGEILYRIAQQYNVSMQDVMAANGIANPNHVLVGQRLVIPGAENVSTVTNTPSITTIPIGTAPEPEIKQGRFILVDLSDSMAYAYENGNLVYTALGSMGLPATPTVVGKFNIYYRLPSQTMSGPGYYLPNVQWVQYFYSGYALHGTYWHNNFGQPMSHGCVNMTNDDAKWFYDFGSIGTPVHVQY